MISRSFHLLYLTCDAYSDRLQRVDDNNLSLERELYRVFMTPKLEKLYIYALKLHYA